MAARLMLLTNARTPHIFLRGPISSPARSKFASPNDELIQKLIIASQKSMTETAVLQRFLYEDAPKVQGFSVGGLSDGRLWALDSDSKFDARLKGRVVDEDEDDDDVVLDYDDDEGVDDDEDFYDGPDSDDESEDDGDNDVKSKGSK